MSSNSEADYIPGRIFAVFSKNLPRLAAHHIIEIDFNLRLIRWRDPWITEELYAAVIAVPVGEENLWCNRLGDHDEIPVTGRELDWSKMQ